MKHIILKTLIAMLVLSSAGFAYAETDTDTNVTVETKQKLRERVENRFEKMNARFQATIERLEGLVVRVQSRIEKIKNAGGDILVAERYVNDAKVSLEAEKVLLISLKTTAEATVALENATTTRAQAKVSLSALAKIAKDIEKNLGSARKSLEKAVGSLKGVSTTVKTETKVQN